VITVGCAVPQQLTLRVMRIGDLERVTQIEACSYSHPWTRGQFLDSLSAGHDARVIADAQEPVIGYSIVMRGVDEVHLLNLTVQASHRRLGHAGRLLDALVQQALQEHRQAIWLEVRVSNEAAQALYRKRGFVATGRRPNYYPAREGREDAILMSLDLASGVRGAD
jgi:[ribosomal protein S18]-alanine N-acetyltransferase